MPLSGRSVPAAAGGGPALARMLFVGDGRAEDDKVFVVGPDDDSLAVEALAANAARTQPRRLGETTVNAFVESQR
jgi:hypothetical protein